MAEQYLLFAEQRQAFLDFEATPVEPASERRPLTDEELLKAYAWNCDNAAFTELHDRHSKAVHRYVRQRFHLDSSRADDACQLIWIEIAKSSWKPIESFASWLRMIAFRAMNKFLRNEESLPESLADDPADCMTAEPIDQAIAAEDEAGIAEAFKRIDPRHRSILTMRVVQGLTLQSIADELGVAERTVTRRVNAALSELQSEVSVAEKMSFRPLFIVEAKRCDEASHKPPRLRKAS
jgi:RNA polymerase sigma factor (sigma-70 family)